MADEHETRLYEVAEQLGYGPADVRDALASTQEDRGGYPDDSDAQWSERRCTLALLRMISADENTTNWVRLAGAALGKPGPRRRDDGPRLLERVREAADAHQIATVERNQAIAVARAAGESLRVIGAAAGLSPQGVSNIVEDTELVEEPYEPTDEDLADMYTQQLIDEMRGK
jgi:hypothetical protein